MYFFVLCMHGVEHNASDNSDYCAQVIYFSYIGSYDESLIINYEYHSQDL